jgi:hypothetical protein
MEENYKEKYESLNRLHISTNESVIKLQDENSKSKDQIILLNEKLANCQKALDINKEIMRNALIEQNRIQTEYGKDIQDLKMKLKQYEGK